METNNSINTNSDMQICEKCGKQKKCRKLHHNMICSSCYQRYFSPKKVCVLCNNEGFANKIIESGPICRSCYSKHYIPVKTCFICNKNCYANKVINNNAVCRSCYNKYYIPKRICSICNKESIINKKTKNGNICKTCYNKYYLEQKVCSICSNKGVINKIIDNKNICKACYDKIYRPREICSICKKEGIINIRVENNAICQSCYSKFYRPQKVCSICGKINKIYKIVGEKNICQTCYPKGFVPVKNCSACGRLSNIAKNIEGKYFCHSCYQKYYRPKRKCHICNMEKLISLKDGDICQSCYDKYYRPKRICSICKNLNFIKLSYTDQDICVVCYENLKGTCQQCGTTTSHFNHSRVLCLNCWNKIKLEQYLTSLKCQFSKDIYYNLYIKFIKECLNYRTPESTLIIANTSLEFFLSINIDYNIRKIPYEYFENFYKSTNNYGNITLQNFLYKFDILEEINYNKKYNEFCIKLSSNLKNNFSSIFLAYTDFLLNMRMQFESRGWNEKFTLSTCKEYALNAYDFMNFISNVINSINELSEDIVCDYLANNHCRINQFLKWINKNIKLFKKITLPKRNYISTEINPYSDEEIEVIIKSLSSNSSSIKEKVIGLLIIFYGFRPNEISKLKINDYKVINSTASLFIRNRWIKINLYISKLIDSYITIERTSKFTLGHSQEWLFFGYFYDKPLSLAYINEIAYKHKIGINRAYRTVIINSFMNHEILPSTLIQGLGLNMFTVMSYYTAMNIKSIHEIPTSLYTSSTSIESSSNFYVYILKCFDGSYYTGYTSNLYNRLEKHQNGFGCTYTKTRIPVELVYSEELPDKPSAIKREKQIKKFNIFEKEQLIEKSRVN